MTKTPIVARLRAGRRTRSLRTVAHLCASATIALIACAAAAAFALPASPSARAELGAEGRAARDIAALCENASRMPRSASIDVPAVQQLPELPTGCESTALTNALLFYRFDLEKTEIADAWLPQSDTDFVTAFMGDPHTSEGHSCMAPAITTAASAYLAAQGSSLEAVDLTGASIDELLRNVEAGHPVIAWCTIGLEDPGTAYQVARAGDRTYLLFANSHCVVLSGYDLDAGTVLVSDSLAGQVAYDLELFAVRYYQLGAQAVAIK